eukprot:5540375-Prymnesium_polylepis.1
MPSKLAQLTGCRNLVILQLATVFAQTLGHMEMPFTDCVTDRRAPPSVGHVHVGTVFEKQLADLEVSLTRSEMQARSPIVIGRIHLCPARQQQLELERVAQARTVAQLTRCLRLGPTEIAARISKRPDDSRVALGSSIRERRFPKRVLPIDGRPALDQVLDHFQLARRRGDVQRCPSLEIYFRHIDPAVFDRLLYNLELSTGRCEEQVGELRDLLLRLLLDALNLLEQRAGRITQTVQQGALRVVEDLRELLHQMIEVALLQHAALGRAHCLQRRLLP